MAHFDRGSRTTGVCRAAAAGAAALQLACASAGVEPAPAPATADHPHECFELPGTGTKSAQPPLARKARQTQGFSSQGVSPQGTGLQRAQFTLAALNGATFELAGAPLVLERGALPIEGSLRGAALDVRTPAGDTFGVQVDEVVRRGELTYYRLSAFGFPVCADDQLGLFLPGGWTPSGEHVPSDSELTYSCEGGVIAKCVAWGYAPWRLDASYHQTCTRLARADYCGDGRSWTRQGTLVNLYDALGVQRSEPSAAFRFEAAWGPDGAVCVNESRYLVTDRDGEPLLPSCWDELPRCDGFGEPGFESALIANDSAHSPITACAE